MDVVLFQKMFVIAPFFEKYAAIYTSIVYVVVLSVFEGLYGLHIVSVLNLRRFWKPAQVWRDRLKTCAGFRNLSGLLNSLA